MKKQKPPGPAIQQKPAYAGTKELSVITQIILSRMKAEKIICFGSIVNNVKKTSCFSRESENISSGENSYYLLIVPAANEHLADINLQLRLEEELKKIAKVTILVHRMEEINSALQNGSSFFVTIYKKGVLLYDNKTESFTSPLRGQHINERITRREKFWVQWHLRSENFLLGAIFYHEKQFQNLAVFMLHQSLQHCYSGMLRVLTGYRSNSNNLRRLLKLIDGLLPESQILSSKLNPENAHLLSLLMKGFSSTRYNAKFAITSAELMILITRIEKIIKQANTTCLNHLYNLRIGKTPYIA